MLGAKQTLVFFWGIVSNNVKTMKVAAWRGGQLALERERTEGKWSQTL